MKTREEVEKLKEIWLKDGCWEIEETPGFEEYYEELKAFSQETQEKFKQAEIAMFEKRAKELNLTVPEFTEYDKAMETLNFHKEKAADLLTHYFSQVIPNWSADNDIEMQWLADHFIEASVNKLKASQILKK